MATVLPLDAENNPATKCLQRDKYQILNYPPPPKQHKRNRKRGGGNTGNISQISVSVHFYMPLVPKIENNYE